MRATLEFKNKNELMQLIKRPRFVFKKPLIKFPEIKQSKSFYWLALMSVIFVILCSFLFYHSGYNNGFNQGTAHGYSLGKFVSDAKYQEAQTNLSLKDFAFQKIKQNWDEYLRWTAIIIGFALLFHGFKVIGR